MGKFSLKRYEAEVIFFKERIDDKAGPLFWGTQSEQECLAGLKTGVIRPIV